MFNIFYYLIGATSLWLALSGVFTGEILGMGISRPETRWVTFQNDPFEFCFQLISFLVIGIAIIGSKFVKPKKDKKE